MKKKLNIHRFSEEPDDDIRPKENSPKETLSLNKKGRLTIPKSIWETKIFKSPQEASDIYYSAKLDKETNELLLLFTRGRESSIKQRKVQRFTYQGQGYPSTAYIDINPPLLSWKYKVVLDEDKDRARVTYDIYEEEKALLLHLDGYISKLKSEESS